MIRNFIFLIIRVLHIPLFKIGGSRATHNDFFGCIYREIDRKLAAKPHRHIGYGAV